MYILLEETDAILGLLKSTPNLKPLILHPSLSEFVPDYFTIDSKFIGDFRARATICHAHNCGRVRDISIKEGDKLCAKTKVNIKELNKINDPLVNTELLSVMRKVMQEYSDTWKFIGYLKKLQTLANNLSYFTEHSS